MHIFILECLLLFWQKLAGGMGASPHDWRNDTWNTWNEWTIVQAFWHVYYSV